MLPFRERPLRLRVLIVAQAVAALSIIAAVWQSPEQEDWAMVALLLLCAVIAGACKVQANIYAARITMGFTVTYLAFLLLGTPVGMVVGLVSTLASLLVQVKDGHRQFTWHKLHSDQGVYNSANCVLSIAVMGWVFERLGGSFGSIHIERLAIPILGSALAYYVVNTVGVTLAIAWSRGVNPVEVFLNHSAWAWPGFLASASMSAGVLLAYQAFQIGFVGLLFLPLAYLVYYSYWVRGQKSRAEVELIHETNRMNEAIISGLAMAIDAKDRTTGKHLSRVREYATGIAAALKVPADELKALRIASLLHDIGKIGIPEHLLCKPGKLTSEEFEIIKTHVDIGVEILERIQFPWPVVPIVWTHHERWDGLGYPRGLKGEDIPIGGRIISVVDVYDALTSTRPYRQAMTPEQGIDILRKNAGSQFDLTVVEKFIELLPELEARVRDMESQMEQDVPSALLAAADRVTRIEEGLLLDESEDAVVLEALADVPESVTPLASFAPILAERIERLVPYTTFALYLKDREGRELIPFYVRGMWPELFEDLAIRVGQGLTGFAVKRAEAVTDSAALDLARMTPPGATLELSSALCAPLKLRGEVIGALTVYHSSYNIYRPYHVKRLGRVARQAVQRMHPAARMHGASFPAGVPIPDEFKLPASR